LSATLQERIKVNDTSPTEASTKWTGSSPSGWRLTRYTPWCRLVASSLHSIPDPHRSHHRWGETQQQTKKAKSQQLSGKPSNI